MLRNTTKEPIRCHAMASVIRSEFTLNSVGEAMLTCLQKRDDTQSPGVLAVLAHIGVHCVDQPLEVIMKKHVQICLHKMETSMSVSMSTNRIRNICELITSDYMSWWLQINLTPMEICSSMAMHEV